MDQLKQREIEAALIKEGMSKKDIQAMRDKRNLLGDGSTSPAHFKRVYKTPSISNIPTGATVKVRFLGDIVPLWIHWVRESSRGESIPCFGSECQRCPDRRILYGYAPVVMGVWNDNGDGEMQMRVLSLIESALPPLVDNELRGWLVSFYRENRRKPPRVEILETSCYGLPPTFDIRNALMQRYGLTTWPDQEVVTEEPFEEQVLKMADYLTPSKPAETKDREAKHG